MKNFYFSFFLFCFASLNLSVFAQESKSPENLNPLQTKSINLKKATQFLKQALKMYHLKTMSIKIDQEIFLPTLNETLKSHGLLTLERKKFRLEMTGNPSSLLLFDGIFLWYQADTNESIVFRLKNHPQIQIFNGLFNINIFFKTFQIKKAKKLGQVRLYHLFPKKNIQGIKEIFLKIDTHILEIRLVWQDLNNWQKLKFSKPNYKKKFQKNHFIFSKKRFEIITKE